MIQHTHIFFVWLDDGQTEPSLLIIVYGLFLLPMVDGQTEAAPAAGQTLRDLYCGNTGRGHSQT